MHLAEFNLAKAKYSLDDPQMAGFVGNLDRINSLAEKMPGYKWRYEGAFDNPALMTKFFGEGTLPNMSVWETPEAFEHFVWNTVHKQFYDRKAEWFEVLEKHYLVMWWVEEGHRPTLMEARQRLDHLNQHGNTDFAFDWGHLPHVKLWQTKRCA